MRTEEIKTEENRVNVKGRLSLRILYVTEEGTVSRMEGQIPFEEQIYAEGVETGIMWKCGRNWKI